MTERRVALLRGVNVGGNKRVAMADLRSLLTGLGYDDVRTYLQSGNVVFSSSSASSRLAAQIEHALAAELRLECRVIALPHVAPAAGGHGRRPVARSTPATRRGTWWDSYRTPRPGASPT